MLRFIALILFALIPLTAAYALGQPASQPALTPAAFDFGAFVAANWQAAAAVVVLGLVVALGKKTWREGAIAFLQSVAEALTKKQPPAK